MSDVLDEIARQQWNYLAGVSGTVTIPKGFYAIGVWVFASGSGGVLIITPAGAAQNATQGPGLPLPAGVPFSRNFLRQLGPGTIFQFQSTTSYFIDMVANPANL